MTAEVLNWNDIKGSDIAESEVENPSYTREYTKDIKIDRSASINHNCCVKVTAAYAKQNGSDLAYNKQNQITHKFMNGNLGGKTVIVKSRRNVYNAGGNFTIKDDEMTADYIAIFSYDGSTHTGTWYIADMTNVRNKTMRRNGDYWICPEWIITNNAIKSFKLCFNN